AAQQGRRQQAPQAQPPGAGLPAGDANLRCLFGAHKTSPSAVRNARIAGPTVTPAVKEGVNNRPARGRQGVEWYAFRSRSEERNAFPFYSRRLGACLLHFIGLQEFDA